MSALASNGMRPASLSVENTEDLLLGSIDRARDILNRLRVKGIRIAIDDFGSGYAAMTYLRELPIDEIKLDRQFVAPILRDPRAELRGAQRIPPDVCPSVPTITESGERRTRRGPSCIA